MNGQTGRQFVRGFWATSLGTLASRVLGLVRDVVTAGLLGLGQGGVMDALVVALRIPNFSRRILGEGALAASLLPVFAAEHERSAQDAWRMLSVLLSVLAIVLTLLVLLGEAVCLGLWYVAGADGETATLVGLTAVMLPYLVFVCLAAQVAAALQGLMRFRWPAFAPALLNVCWLAAAWLVAPRWSGDRVAQAYVIGVAVVLSGVLQLAVLIPPLYRAGFRFAFDRAAALPAVRRVWGSLLPIALALGITQINTLVDSLLAVSLSARPGTEQAIAWLGGAVSYPFQTGAAAAIYYGERLYQFPVGVLGLAIATVTYPSLTRHAARGDLGQVGRDLTAGLRMVWFLALPAGVGLMLLAEPIARLLFVRGAFTDDDAHRAAVMIACYASATWAFCALPVLVRGYYAVGDRATPLRIGLLAVGVDLLITVALMWPLGERGLAISTAVAATVQAILLAALLVRNGCPLVWRELRPSLAKGAGATLAMAVVVTSYRHFAAAPNSAWGQAGQLAIAIVLGGGMYLLAARLFGMPELAMLWQDEERRVAIEKPYNTSQEVAVSALGR